VNCPTCHTVIDPLEHPGLIINRRAFIGSQLLTLRAQAERIRPLAASMHKQSEGARATLAACEAQIVALTAEIAELDFHTIPDGSVGPETECDWCHGIKPDHDERCPWRLKPTE
jgi:hypothetical protein